ncbi:alpha/beta hydrolase [Achromobacter sp. Root83]|uniref:alpha/beta fold hydrolase n=1 Tax=Achromobacter sp. Root83 TaxID=1736602 RepID=UPI00070C4C2E|nr:alpha/beta hydrolase [Achromobacter sp. Root83]KRC83284.1 alpha/beta hydrolase [Achromobacter sp. Root83]
MSTMHVGHIAVEVDGEGDPILCLHGLGGSSNTWTPVMSAFGGHRVIRPDLPGSARSGLPDAALSIARYVDSMVDLLAALGAARVHVVAHSMGTIVAQHLAVEHPGLVRSLALFGPLLAPPDQGRAGIQARARLARERGIAGMQEIADAIVTGATSAKTKERHTAVLALVRESVMRQTPEGYAQSCEALAKAQPADLEKITAPALLVTGDEDGVGTPAQARSMAARLATASVHVLEDCGHWTPCEQAGQCAGLLTKFHASLA